MICPRDAADEQSGGGLGGHFDWHPVFDGRTLTTLYSWPKNVWA